MFKSRVWTKDTVVRTVAHPLQVISIQGFARPDHGDERPDGWTSTLNFHICYACVQTMRGNRLEGWSRIGNFLHWWTRVRTKAIWRPNGCIWIVILALWRRVSKWNTTSSGRLIDLPFIGTLTEFETGWVQRGIRTGYWDVWTDASWTEISQHSGWSERKCT
jgi:hypothetical protein